MKVRLATSKDKQLLQRIKSVLVNKWVNSKVSTQYLSENFDRKISSAGSQILYAVLINSQDQIVIIASLYLEYKLTRGLSQVYHLELDYSKCNPQQQIFFQEQAIQMIPGYKITGLNVTESKYFPPHQIYMQIDLQTPQKLKGAL